MKRFSWNALFHAATIGSAAFGAIAAFAEYRGLAVTAGILASGFGMLSAYASYFDSGSLRALFSERTLKPRQRKLLIEALKEGGNGFLVELDWSQSREAEAYASDIRSALEAAGCKVTTNGAVTPEGAYWGVLGPGPDYRSVESARLHQAFKVAGIKLRPVLDVSALPRILVATKPPLRRPVPPEQPISGIRPNPPFED